MDSRDGYVEDPFRPGYWVGASGISVDLVEGEHFAREGQEVRLIKLPETGVSWGL